MSLLAPRKGMSKGKVMLLLAVMYISTVCTMADMLITPISNEFYVLYADYPSELVSLGITGTCLSAMPFMLLAGWLCDHFNKKSLMLVGFGIYMVGGLCGGLVENVYYWIFSRLLVGVAWGMTNSAAYAIFSDFFDDDEQAHSQAVAGYAISLSLLGSLLAYVGGFLATFGWQAVYYGYVVSIPIFILLIIFLPSFPPKNNQAAAQTSTENNEAEEVAGSANQSGWWKHLLPLLIKVILCCVCFYEVQYMVSFFVEDASIGDSVFSGTLISLLTLGGMGGSLIYPSIRKALGGKWAYIPGLVVVGASFLIMAFFPNRIVAIICCILIGVGYMSFYCYYYADYATLVPSQKIGVATGLVGFCEACGNFLSSYVLLWIAGLTASGSTVDVWWVFGAVVLAVVLFSLFGTIRKKSTDEDNA